MQPTVTWSWSAIVAFTSSRMSVRTAAGSLCLARRHRLSGYDAAYLETALRRGAKLATLDRKLATAAAREGVSVDAG